MSHVVMLIAFKLRKEASKSDFLKASSDSRGLPFQVQRIYFQNAVCK